jgi:hypothetical protein
MLYYVLPRRSWAVSMLHFYGILKPNPEAKQVG